jgi:S-adenosylmethionine uptake transporter
MASRPEPRGEPSPILVAAAAIFLGCAMDAAIKHIGASNGMLTIALARFGIGAVVSAIIFFVARAPAIPLAKLKLHAIRAVSIVIAAPLFFYALTVLPLTEAMTFGFTAPLITPFMAAIALKEKLRPYPVAAAAIGFVGVAIAAFQPSSAAVSPQHTLGVYAIFVSVFAYSGSLILLRYRATEDSPYAIGLMGNLMPAALLAIPTIVLEPLPQVSALPWFALIGALGAVFWLMLTWAYGRATPQILAPLEYTGLLWGTAWSVLVFHEGVQPRVFVGALFIVAACVLVSWDEHRNNATPEISI